MAKITKEVLSEALKKLLKKKNWESIKVTELVAVAGVNRQTFYYNFEDIYDLLKWTVNKEINLAFETITDHESWKECFTNLFRSIQNNEKTIINIVHSSARPYFEQILKESLEPIVERVLRFYKNGQKDIPEKSFQFIIKTYTFLVVMLVFEWVDSGMKDEVEDFVAPYFTLFEGSYSFLADKFISDRSLK